MGRWGIRRFISLGVLAGAAAIAAAPPASAQMVTGEPPLANSSNVQLLGHIPGTAAGMNFKGHYAYVTGWAGVTVLDIAKPETPQLVGALTAAALRERGRRPLRQHPDRRQRP